MRSRPTLPIVGSTGTAILNGTVTAKEKLLAQAQNWSEHDAEVALQAVEQQAELAAYLDAEAKLSSTELQARENTWATGNARAAVREEPW